MTRAIVPLIAGIGSMTPRRFIVLDVVSAVLWAPAHVFGGVVVSGLALWSLPYLVRGTIDVLARGRRPLLVWASRKDDWLRRQVRSLLDPGRTELPGLLALCAGLVWLDWIKAWRAAANGIASVIGAVLFTAGLDLALRLAPASASPGRLASASLIWCGRRKPSRPHASPR